MTEKNGNKEQNKNKNGNRRATGAVYERAAGTYLEQAGLEVMEYNYRCRAGEIDLIARDGEYLVFCEVKYRENDRLGAPLEAVDERKQRTIFRCAMYYLTQRRMADVPCRFDVIVIEGSRITHIKNAFTG